MKYFWQRYWHKMTILFIILGMSLIFVVITFVLIPPPVNDNVTPINLIHANWFSLWVHNCIVVLIIIVLSIITKGWFGYGSIGLSWALLLIKASFIYYETNDAFVALLIYLPHTIIELLAYGLAIQLSKVVRDLIFHQKQLLTGYQFIKIILLIVSMLVIASMVESCVPILFNQWR